MIKLLFQIFKFGIVGVLCFGIDYGLLYWATEYLNIPYFISSVLAFSVSVVVNYFLSRKFVFKMKEHNQEVVFVTFVLLSVAGLIINEVVLLLLTEIFGVYYMISKIVATGIVMVYNFVTRKSFMEN